LGERIQQGQPALSREQCLDKATLLRRQVNDYHQEVLGERAAALYAELQGHPALYQAAILSAGNMADATGIALTTGNKHGTPDYIALLNTAFEGRVAVHAH